MLRLTAAWSKAQRIERFNTSMLFNRLSSTQLPASAGSSEMKKEMKPISSAGLATNQGKPSFSNLSLRESLRRVTMNKLPKTSAPPTATPSPNQISTSPKPETTNTAKSSTSLNNENTTNNDAKNQVKNSESSSTSAEQQPLTPTIQSISQDILNTIKTTKTIEKQTISLEKQKMENAEKTEGEIRYQQKYQKEAIKRSKLAEELGENYSSKQQMKSNQTAKVNQTNNNNNINYNNNNIRTNTSNNNTTNRPFNNANNKSNRPPYQSYNNNNSTYDNNNNNIRRSTTTSNMNRTSSYTSTTSSYNNRSASTVYSTSSIRSNNNNNNYNNNNKSNAEEVFDIAKEKEKLQQKIKNKQQLQLQHSNKQSQPEKISTSTPAPRKTLVIPESSFTIKELAHHLSMKISDLKMKLIALETGSNVTSSNNTNSSDIGQLDVTTDKLDKDLVELLLLDLQYDVKHSATTNNNDNNYQQPRVQLGDIPMITRAPTVCIVGHVDHGKTTLLDALRNYNNHHDNLATSVSSSSSKAHSSDNNNNSIAAKEAGGITQRLSAFALQFPTTSNTPSTTSSSTTSDTTSEVVQQVVFVDTPGHAAFSRLRTRGALATDIAIVVIAYDDGLKAQTIEAIQTILQTHNSSRRSSSGSSSHSLTPAIIALTKCDKFLVTNDKVATGKLRQAQRTKILSQVVEHGLIPEEFGGDVQVVDVSGKTREGLGDLLDKIRVLSEMLADDGVLTVPKTGPGVGSVLDTRMERGRGLVTDVVVTSGNVKVGDIVVVGTVSGRVKAMFECQQNLSSNTTTSKKDETAEDSMTPTNNNNNNQPQYHHYDYSNALDIAYPSQVVHILGLKPATESSTTSSPEILPSLQSQSTAQELMVVETETVARQIVERRQRIEALKQQQSILNINNNSNNTQTNNNNNHSPKKRGSKDNTTTEEVPSSSRSSSTPSEVLVPLIIKADAAGSLEAMHHLVTTLQRQLARFYRHFNNNNNNNNHHLPVKIVVAGSSLGNISAHDVHLLSYNPTQSASQSNNNNHDLHNPLILGFNVGFTDLTTKSLSRTQDIPVMTNSVIYRLEDVLYSHVASLLPPQCRETKEGHAKVLKLFSIRDGNRGKSGSRMSSGSQPGSTTSNSDNGTVTVAGLQVTHGRLITLSALNSNNNNNNNSKQSTNNSSNNNNIGDNQYQIAFRILRQQQVVYEHLLGSANTQTVELRRFKDVVPEVTSGHECGLLLTDWQDWQEQDEIEVVTRSFRPRLASELSAIDITISDADDESLTNNNNNNKNSNNINNNQSNNNKKTATSKDETVDANSDIDDMIFDEDDDNETVDDTRSVNSNIKDRGNSHVKKHPAKKSHNNHYHKSSSFQKKKTTASKFR
jgi:small GTP-binding protein